MSVPEPPDAPVVGPPGDEPPSPLDPAADPAFDELAELADLGPADVEPITAEGEVEEVLAQYPPVVAVVVTRNPGPWFEDTLNSLAGQDYDDLTVLVVDTGSQEDLTPRVAAVLPRAFVRPLGADAGFSVAANEALHVVEGATFLLFCHDDVVLDESAVRLMVEEGYRSNAGIAGPKLVSAENPEILLEVGRGIDRFGAPFTGIEPGEVDQEQHDGVRDVFYVTTAVMLVRTDLFVELGGFDPETYPGAEDLDLCWRRDSRVHASSSCPTRAQGIVKRRPTAITTTGPTSSPWRGRASACCSRRTRCGSSSGWYRSGSWWGSWRRWAT